MEMKGIVIGMILAAMVGAGSSYGIGALMPQKAPQTARQYSDDAALTAVTQQITELGNGLDKRIDEVSESVGLLTARVESFDRNLQSLKQKIAAAPSSGAAPVSGAQEALAVAPQPIDEAVVRRVLEEKDRQEREQAEQRRVERQQQFSEMVQSRIDTYAKEKGWDVTKTEAVKNILNESSKKMSELFREGGRRSPETGQNMNTLMEETRKKLAEILTEEELNDLTRVMMPFGGPRRAPGSEGQQPAVPTPEGR
jgi:hypothetical protein